METVISTYGFAGDLFAFILCAVCVALARSNYAIKHDNLKLFYIGIFIVAYASMASIIFHLMMV